MLTRLPYEKLRGPHPIAYPNILCAHRPLCLFANDKHKTHHGYSKHKIRVKSDKSNPLMPRVILSQIWIQFKTITS